MTARQSDGHQSVTMPLGITVPYSQHSLLALLVVCHEWRSPARQPTVHQSVGASPGAWLGPVLSKASLQNWFPSYERQYRSKPYTRDRKRRRAA